MMYYMTYSSTITSKGTITLPSRIRKYMGITTGQKVTIRMRGEAIEVVPQRGWDEFFAATSKIGREARQKVASGEIRPLLTNDDIQAAVSKARENNDC